MGEEDQAVAARVFGSCLGLVLGREVSAAQGIAGDPAAFVADGLGVQCVKRIGLCNVAQVGGQPEQAVVGARKVWVDRLAVCCGRGAAGAAGCCLVCGCLHFSLLARRTLAGWSEY